MDENSIKLADLIAKYLFIMIGGVWTLMVGTDFIDKKTAEYKFEALQLGSEGIYPRAKTQLNIDGYGKRSLKDPSVCEISGKYIITNIGEYLTKIESVKFQLYEKEIESAIAVGNSGKPQSYSLSPSIEGLTPIISEEMNVQELIAKGNKIERSFGYLVKTKTEHNYIIVASAQGGLVGAKDISQEISQFQENDLTHKSGSHSYCQ